MFILFTSVANAHDKHINTDYTMSKKIAINFF